MDEEPTVTLREHMDVQRRGDLRLAELKWSAHEKEWRVFKSYAEKRWSDLNGEAGRLKTILEASVPLTSFNAYVSAQRDKDEARDKAQRDAFAAYASSQATAFQKYSEDMKSKLDAINTRIATFVGGGLALFTALQLWLTFGMKP